MTMKHVGMELIVFIVVFSRLMSLLLLLSYYGRILITNVNSLCLFTIIMPRLLTIAELSLELFRSIRLA